MTCTVFKKEDFVLCDVPVPNGYPQSQTHTGIKIHNGLFFLTTSPYPNPKRRKWKVYSIAILKKVSFGFINLFYKGEDYENPCIYIGKTRSDTTIPISFELLSGGPLMDKPYDNYGYGSYNSDPDLYIEGDAFYIINREFVRHPDPQKVINKVYLIKGSFMGGTFVKEKIQMIFNHDIGKSPCLTKYNNTYYLFSLDTNSYNDGTACKALVVRKSKDSLLEWNKEDVVKIEKGKYEPWHLSVFENNGRLFAIIACIEKGVKKRCWQMLGEFNQDLSCLKIYQTPLTDYSSYRGAACVNKNGEFVLYNTTVHEKIAGSKSVDGRDVIMAHMQFDKLLSIIRDYEQG